MFLKKIDLLGGNIREIFIRYLVPSVGGMLGVSLYVLGDTMVVGRGIGSAGLAALNISIPMINVLHGLGLLFGMGASTAISISRGKGDDSEVDNIFTTSVFFSLLVGLAFLFIRLFFLDELSLLLGASPETFDMSTDYLAVVLTFAPMFLLNYTLNVLVRNDGNPKLSMYGMLTGSIVNVILDYIFVFYFNWGMAGVGLATSLSPVLGLIILSFHFILKQNKMNFTKFKFKLKNLFRIFSNGFASFIIEISAGFVIFIFNIVILDLAGDIGVSAYSVIANLSLIATAIFTGIGQSIQPMVSINFGARQMKRVYEAAKLAIYSSLGLGVIFYGIGLLFPEFLVSIFSQGDEGLLRITVKGIRIYFSAFLLMGVNITITSFLQSKEYGRASTLMSLSRGAIMIFIFLMILPKLFGLSGVWFTMPLAELSTFIGFIAFYSTVRELTSYSFIPERSLIKK